MHWITRLDYKKEMLCLIVESFFCRGCQARANQSRRPPHSVDTSDYLISLSVEKGLEETATHCWYIGLPNELIGLEDRHTEVS